MYFIETMNWELFQKITYAILGFFSGFIFGFLWEISTSKIRHLAHQNGHHYHHSLFGLGAFLFIPKFLGDLNKMFFITGFGLGVIVQHAIKEGLIFITKD